MDCPKCQHVALLRCQNEFGNFWHCERCEGTAVTLPLLRRLVGRSTINALWQGARQWDYPERCQCPGCDNRMEEVPIQTPAGERKIDVCSHCQFVWLDAGEWEDLPHADVEPVAQPKRQRSPAMTERQAMERLKRVKEDQGELLPSGPDQLWQWIPALLGMPIEHSQPSGNGKPWMTWMTAVFITAMSLLAFADLERMIQAYGLIPSEWDRMGGLTFLSSFFLHGGVLHLVGNLYFLLIFGDNAENELGSGKFLLLLFAAIFAGDLLHVAYDPYSTIPCVGASGGISGVIAFYALRFPTARLSILHLFFFYPVWFRLRAIWAFGVWILLQIYLSYAQIQGLGTVSAAAHIGGAIVGVFAWFIWRLNRPDQKREQMYGDRRDV